MDSRVNHLIMPVLLRIATEQPHSAANICSRRIGDQDRVGLLSEIYRMLIDTRSWVSSMST